MCFFYFKKIRFYYDQIQHKKSHLSLLNYCLPKCRLLTKMWPIRNIKYYVRKRYVLRKTAIEFYCKDGNEFLLNFHEKREMELFLEKL